MTPALLIVLLLLTQPVWQTRATGQLQGTPQATFGSVLGGSGQQAPTVSPEAAATATMVPTAVPTQAATEASTEASTAAATFSPTPLPTLTSSLMGIQIYANIEQNRWFGMVDRAQFMGFKWIKIQLSWKELEPAKGQYTQHFDVVKDAVFYAGQRGFKILLSIAKAPDWARPANARGQNDGPPANPQDLADLITHIFDTFSKEHISAIEIWNEANLTTEWTGAAQDGVSYMRLFNVAYQRIRQQSPDIVVLTAGPAPTGGGGSIGDRDWLQAIYAASGKGPDLALNKADPNLAIGIHPYGWANPPDERCCQSGPPGWNDNKVFFFLDTIYDYRDIMVKNGHQGGKLWATEFGWASYDGLHANGHSGPPAMPPADDAHGWMKVLNEQQQATYIIRAYQLAQSGDLATFMGPMFLWNMNWSSLEGHVNSDKPSEPDAGFSVLDSDWYTRPAYLLLQSAPKQ